MRQFVDPLSKDPTQGVTPVDPVTGYPGIVETASQYGVVVGTITASAQTLVVPVPVFNGVTFSFWGTFAGIALAFEACYDGVPTNWVACQALSIGGGAPVTSISGLAAAGAYEVYAPGASHIRVRSTAWTSGTMNIKGDPSVFVSDNSPASPAPYNPSQTQAIASASGANASTVATLAAQAAKTNYLSGFEVTSGGATAASLVTVTVAGLLGGSLVYNFGVPAGATLAATPLVVAFNPPLAASAVNTAITVTMGAAGAGNTTQLVNAQGFYQ